MKVELLYFSGTGNTWWVARKLAERLDRAGWKTRLISFESEERLGLPSCDADMFGLAFPTYGTGPPLNVDEYLHHIKDGEGKECFVITTFAGYNGSTACDAARVLRGRGFKPVLACGVNMPMNAWVPVVDGWPIPKPGMEETIRARKKERALPKIEKICEWLISGRKVFRWRDPLNHLISRGQYLFYKPFISFVLKRLSVGENCNHCGLCERICPRSNIKVTEERVEFGDRCIACMRCLTFCPEKAILFDGKTGDYYRYPGVGDGYKPQKVKHG